MEAFLRIYLVCFFVIFVAWVFIVPSVAVFRKTGINPFRFATKHNAVQDYVGNSMKIFIVLLFAVVITYACSGKTYGYLVPIAYLNHQYLKIAGLVLIHISLIGIKFAQRDMRLAWRIGIDYENKTSLVTNGLFSMSRNPVYLFLLIGLIGIFTVLPNALTLVVLFSAYLVLQITMRLEEEFLEKAHGDLYSHYKKEVKRLI